MSEINERVEHLENAVFGDRSDFDARPGIISEIRRMADEQKRSGELLSDVRDSLKRLNWMVLTAVVSALLAVVLKGGVHL